MSEGRIAGFGEIVLRLCAPRDRRLVQTRQLDIHVGGAEANAIVSLAQFGHQTKMISTLADNALGDLAIGELARFGVDTRDIFRTEGRVGLYFLETGSVRRPSRITYDRVGSAFALAETYDWSALLRDVEWLHISGVTPAINAHTAAMAQAAVSVASQSGIQVSFDGNYREQLWRAWNGKSAEILKGIISCATVAFVNERDVNLILGSDYKDCAAAHQACLEAFPNIQWLAATDRQQTGAEHHVLSAILTGRDGVWRAEPCELLSVVDRIGGGDAFSAGMLHGLITKLDPQHAVRFAVAASALKHSIKGDFNIASINDVMEMIEGGGLDVQR